MGSGARIVIVEDHPLVCVGLRTALTCEGYDVVGEALDGPTGLRLALELRPEALVVDIGLPGMDGIQLTRAIRSELPCARVVILTMHDLSAEVFAALAAGADAYCVKASDPSGIITALRVAIGGGAYFDPQVAHAVLREFSSSQQGGNGRSPLSGRETQILRLISEGMSNVEIAGRVYLSLGTIKGHIRDILDKLSASDRTAAAVTALRRGLI